MPGVVLLVAAIVVNYAQHTARRFLPRPVSAAALTGGWLYLAVHLWRGYPKESL